MTHLIVIPPIISDTEFIIYLEMAQSQLKNELTHSADFIAIKDLRCLQLC